MPRPFLRPGSVPFHNTFTLLGNIPSVTPKTPFPPLDKTFSQKAQAAQENDNTQKDKAQSFPYNPNDVMVAKSYIRHVTFVEDPYHTLANPTKHQVRYYHLDGNLFLKTLCLPRLFTNIFCMIRSPSNSNRLPVSMILLLLDFQNLPYDGLFHLKNGDSHGLSEPYLYLTKL